MTTIAPNWCRFCKNNKGDGTCRAFHDGIPFAFTLGDPHTAPVPGQTGDAVFTLDLRKQDEFNMMQPYLATTAEESG